MKIHCPLFPQAADTADEMEEGRHILPLKRHFAFFVATSLNKAALPLPFSSAIHLELRVLLSSITY